MKKIIFENKNFKLTINENAEIISLINKSCNEELIPNGAEAPLFSATQDRPYNNEIKLAYMNKKTTFYSISARLKNGKLLIKFGLYPFEAQINVDVKDEYMVFTLEKFIADEKNYPQPMDFPPVSELSLIRIPLDKKQIYGQWMNVCHTDKTSVAVMGTSPHAFVDSEVHGNIRTLTASVRREIKLIGCSAALIVSDKEKFLDAVDSLEKDFGLPRGVKSRKSNYINASIYFTADICPTNVDEHIAYAKRGGFRLMLFSKNAMCNYEGNHESLYELAGDYGYNKNYPNGEADMRFVLKRVKDAGIIPGLHFLHTHIGIETKYVTPKADRRLGLKRRFSLSKPLGTKETVIYVDENPIGSPIKSENIRLLRFDGEIISYEGYSTEYPYHFYGCKRGYYDTTVTEHNEYCVGGVLDVSEYFATSIYLDQNSDLQEEIADKIKSIYDLGFEFAYFDGSEGTNAPYEFHIPNAQYRIYKKFENPPLFCSGAAKAHFSWHMLSGSNAFDAFNTSVFKKMILKHPLKEAKLMRIDHTCVNFGWWVMFADTRVDVYEFGTSKAASYDCPATVLILLDLIKKNPRADDILDMMQRWELVREKKLLTEDDKARLRDPGTEYTLLKNKNEEYELTPYYSVPVADTDAPDAVIGMPRQINEETKSKSSLRAFVFERHGNSCAVVWDDIGTSILTLATNKIISYSHEIETKDIPYTISNNSTTFSVSSRAYIQTSCTIEELARLLKIAKTTCQKSER